MSAKTTGKKKSKGLGRGLGALLPNQPVADVKKESEPASKEPRVYFKAQIEDVYPSPEQPRRRFAEVQLEELAQSIREHGIIQPLIVRARPEGGYFLIAGERRWRASQRAGLTEVPIVVQELSSQESFERAIVENVQRADLNAIEEALAFKRLMEEFSLSQEQVASKVGKERSTIANALRLLKLPNSVRGMVEEERLGMGHARALLSLPSPSAIENAARNVIKDKLSVRATEALVRKTLKPTKSAAKPAGKSASVRDVENRLTKSLGAAVSLTEKASGKGGKIEIKYADLDDLDRLLERLLHR